ncbi:glutamate ABC transporter substrate-binding protein [Corynebacterium sp. SCR221107]|uniref:glutamate ABC transporter substrate-binding protein n=1 Tax=Corynebacterium sp. SCR221107 TaxID=3017361 RepID=UPI0022EC7C17|nr:glutamate ABC transporter substrate-binding protein [Corynebacterium sp. SCR221107]WBT08459.1 glutamate ABC transporter substrate-binding protein [Corynebacterium sp. SCR221107]
MSTRHSFHRYVSPAGLMRVACLTTATALLLTSCAEPEPAAPEPAQETQAYLPLPDGSSIEKAGSVAPEEVITTGLLGSLRPDERTPEERVPEIVARGRLIVGIDQSQYLLSFREPSTGAIKGFEVDIARQIARDIFGDPNKVEFRFVDSSNWLKSIEDEKIDLAIRGISITRDRQDQVFFSASYLTGQTRMLVEKNTGIDSIDDLAGGTACVTSGSTGQQRTRARAPETDLLVANSAADCLVALQQGQVQAIISDDTILSGMVAQDPFTEIVGDPLGTESYGIAIAKPGTRHDTDGLIRQVNSTLERLTSDRTWAGLYLNWFGPYLPLQQPPAAAYREEQAPH